MLLDQEVTTHFSFQRRRSELSISTSSTFNFRGHRSRGLKFPSEFLARCF